MIRATAVPETVTIHVPFRSVKRGGRSEMQMPDGAALPRSTDSTLVKALARAFRWKRMLESGEFATIGELGGGVDHDNRAVDFGQKSLCHILIF